LGENVCGFSKKEYRGGYPHLSLVADSTGLVYCFWYANNNTSKYCDTAYVSILDSATDSLHSPNYVEIPACDIIFGRGISADIAEGDTTNTIYIAWAGKDSELDPRNKTHYAEILFSKQCPDSFAVQSDDSISSSAYDVRDPAVQIGGDGDIHFGWSDARCHTEDRWKSVFYRKLTSGGWVDGPDSMVCRDSWNDSATLVNYACESDSGDSCCPRASSDCEETLCSRHGSAPAKIFREKDSGTLHLVWQDTDDCYKKKYPEIHAGDVILHRSLDSGDWSGIRAVAKWESWKFDACITPDDEVVVAAIDKLNPGGDATCGYWYWWRSAGDTAFSEPESLFILSTEDSCQLQPQSATWYVPSSQMAITAGHDSTLHFQFEMQDPDDVGNVHYRRVSEPGGTLSDICQLSHVPEEPQGPLEDDQDHGLTGSLIVDACGNVHSVFGVKYVEETGGVPAYDHAISLYRVVVGDTVCHYDLFEPDGGESLCIAGDYHIRWRFCPRSDRRVISQSIEFSDDAGETYDTIADNLDPLVRAYTWTIEESAADNCRIKVKALTKRWDDNTSAWVEAEPCSCVSSDTFTLYNCGPCPHLYAWKDGDFRLENSILERSEIRREPAEDHILVGDCQPDETGMLRFLINQIDPDTTYFWNAHLKPICSPTNCVVTDDGRLFELGEILPAVSARRGSKDVLARVSEADGDAVIGTGGDVLTLHLPTPRTDEGLIVVNSEHKIPQGAGAVEHDGEGGLELVIGQGGRFLSGADTLRSLWVHPRQFSSTLALRFLPVPSEGQLELEVTWHSRHPIDFLGICPDPKEYVEDHGILEPVHIGFKPVDGGISDPTELKAPYRMVPGDKLFLTFKTPDCFDEGSRSCVLSLLGYYVGPAGMAGIDPAIHAFAMWPASPLPCRGPSFKAGFSIPAAARVSVEVYDVRGRLVKRILDRNLQAGDHNLEWDLKDGHGTEVSSGVYFARLTTERGSLVQKVVVKK
jgi:hypothetical protein